MTDNNIHNNNTTVVENGAGTDGNGHAFIGETKKRMAEQDLSFDATSTPNESVDDLIAGGNGHSNNMKNILNNDIEDQDNGLHMAKKMKVDNGTAAVTTQLLHNSHHHHHNVTMVSTEDLDGGNDQEVDEGSNAATVNTNAHMRPSESMETFASVPQVIDEHSGSETILEKTIAHGQAADGEEEEVMAEDAYDIPQETAYEGGDEMMEGVDKTISHQPQEHLHKPQEEQPAEDENDELQQSQNALGGMEGLQQTREEEEEKTIPHSPAKSGVYGGSQVSVVSNADGGDDSENKSGVNEGGNPQALHNLQMKWCMNALKIMKRHHDAAPFLKPVDPIALGIPDYLDVIKTPMDLQTIETKLTDKVYETHEAFIADVEQVFRNCFTYNPPNHPVHIMGKNLEKSFQNQLKKIPQPGDELKIETKNFKVARSSSVNPSPLSSRPQRDVHPPTNYWPEDHRASMGGSKKGKKASAFAQEMRWCQNVHKELTKKQYEAFMFPFYLPVDPIALGIPQYFDIIKDPMDLSTMKKKLDSGEYETATEYEADFRLMVRNCLTFNRPGDDVYMMGQKAEELFNRKWREKPEPPAPTSARESIGKSSGSGSSKKKQSQPQQHYQPEYQHQQMIDFESSTDDEVEDDAFQIKVIEQQIKLLTKQVEALREKRRKNLIKRKEKAARRRSSGKGGSHPHLVEHHHHHHHVAPSASAESTSAAPPPVAAPPAPAPPPKKPKKEPAPKKPKGKVGRPKKTYDPPEIREITFEEKKELSEAIPMLSADKLNQVVKIIHESMPHLKDNAGDEIELDIDALDLVTLNKLWYFVRGSKKRKNKNGDPAANASRISELEMQLAMIDGRPDKVSRFQGINDSSSDSSSSDDSDDSDSGSE